MVQTKAEMFANCFTVKTFICEWTLQILNMELINCWLVVVSGQHFRYPLTLYNRYRNFLTQIIKKSPLCHTAVTWTNEFGRELLSSVSYSQWSFWLKCIGKNVTFLAVLSKLTFDQWKQILPNNLWSKILNYKIELFRFYTKLYLIEFFFFWFW